MIVSYCVRVRRNAELPHINDNGLLHDGDKPPHNSNSELLRNNDTEDDREVSGLSKAKGAW